MSTLVERLRKWTQAVGPRNFQSEFHPSILDEAADRIAALEADLSARTADLASVAAERDRALKIERLALAQVKETTAVLELVAAERDALRTALERCASFLREWDDGENLSPEKGWNFAEFEAEHAAIRSALQPSKTEAGDEQV